MYRFLLKQTHKDDFMKAFLSILCLTVLLNSCGTFGGNPNKNFSDRPTATKAPAKPQRIFDPIDTTGKTLGDIIVVSEDEKAQKFSPDKKTVILAAAYFVLENKLETITVAQKADIARLIFNNIPISENPKELVLPKFSLNKDDGQTNSKDLQDAYLFITQSKDGNTPVFKIQSNIPIASIYAPGTYDGYIVERAASFSIGSVPATWVANFFIYYKGDYISYWGPAFPKVCSPLIIGNDSVKPDRLLDTVKAGPDAWKSNRQNAINLQKSIADQWAKESDGKTKDSLTRLNKSLLLTIAYYSFLLGDNDQVDSSIKQNDAIPITVPKSEYFDNLANLKKLLSIAKEIDKSIINW